MPVERHRRCTEQEDTIARMQAELAAAQAELAAARARVLAPGQIAAGLSDRFRLLTGGVQGAPARQRTLEASLAGSYDLLDDVQRLALARLSVFAGSFELDAAEAAGGGHRVG